METANQTLDLTYGPHDTDPRARPAYTAENIASALAQLGASQLSDSPLGVIRDCTPEYAAELLKLRPTYQRKVDPRHAARIAVSIAIDRYYFLGDTIKFSANLDCVDGQHRLTAIAQGTAHLDLYVAIVPYEAFVYIDATQKTRTMEQIAKAHLERTIHGSVISGLLFDLHNFELRARSKMSRADCIALVADHPLLETIIQLHHEGTPKKLASGILAGAARCMRSEYPEEAHRFFFAVARNDHTVDGEYSPACKMLCDHHLMVARTRNRRETQSTEGWQREEAARAIHAFNAYLRREPITMLRGTTDGVFPTVHRRGVRGQAKGLPVMTRSRNGRG